MYKSNTRYVGFTTGKVYTNEDGSQYVWIKNDGYDTLIWTDGVESTWIKDK
jgi:hypothetical protein